MYKVGTRVNTPNGAGTIIDHELWDRGCSRYVITLDNNPFSYDKVCYWFKEVKKNKETYNCRYTKLKLRVSAERYTKLEDIKGNFGR